MFGVWSSGSGDACCLCSGGDQHRRRFRSAKSGTIFLNRNNSRVSVIVVLSSCRRWRLSCIPRKPMFAMLQVWPPPGRLPHCPSVHSCILSFFVMVFRLLNIFVVACGLQRLAVVGGLGALRRVGLVSQHQRRSCAIEVGEE
jgi:hypothetical protein